MISDRRPSFYWSKAAQTPATFGKYVMGNQSSTMVVLIQDPSSYSPKHSIFIPAQARREHLPEADEEKGNQSAVSCYP
eukprot:1159364-Pelagomonas_calceolata.AAC.10